MSVICEAEVQREARRILRKLSEGAVLAPERGGKYALRFPLRAARAIRLRGTLVRQFKARGWIRPQSKNSNLFVLSATGADWLAQARAGGDGFSAQHQVLTRRTMLDGRGREQAVIVNEGESPLGWLRHRKHITAAQFAAGDRLRRDFTLAGLMPRLCADLSAPVVDGRRAQNAAELSEIVVAARQRFNRALDAAGPGLSDLLVDVCCHLAGLEDCEKRKDWPRRSARIVLSLALDRLAAHYGFNAKERTRSPIRSWSAQSEGPPP